MGKINFIIVGFFFTCVSLNANVNSEVQNLLRHTNQSSTQLHDSLFRLYQSIKKEESELGAGKRFGTILEREERFNKLKPINESLEPIKPLIISYAKESTDEVRSLAINLLEYIKSDEKVLKVLYELTEDQKFFGKASDIIFSLGKDNPDLRQTVVEKIKNEDFKGNEYQSIPYWKIKEALPLYIDYLNFSQKSINITNANAKLREALSKSSKRNFRTEFAAKALKELGEDAVDSLSALKKALEKARSEGADFRTIEALEFAIQSIEVDILESKGISGLSATTNQTISNIAVTTPKTETSQEIENSKWLKWMLIVAGVSVLGFLVFSSFGKKSANKKK